MPRELTAPDGTTWSCVPPYQGLAEGGPMPEAARVEGSEDCYYLVCTPSGGAQSVRVQVGADWESMPDDALLAAIAAAGGGA